MPEHPIVGEEVKGKVFRAGVDHTHRVEVIGIHL
jgi:hypothetical protein